MSAEETQESVHQCRELTPVYWWCAGHAAAQKHIALEMAHRMPFFFWKEKFNVKCNIWIRPLKQTVEMSLHPSCLASGGSLACTQQRTSNQPPSGWPPHLVAISITLPGSLLSSSLSTHERSHC